MKRDPCYVQECPHSFCPAEWVGTYTSFPNLKHVVSQRHMSVFNESVFVTSFSHVRGLVVALEDYLNLCLNWGLAGFQQMCIDIYIGRSKSHWAMKATL